MKKRVLVLGMVGLLSLLGIVVATSTMNPRITYTGVGIPDPSVGRLGDLYIDLNTNVLYVMGTDGWGDFAVLPTPVNGTDGLDGATWITGDTNPTDNLGRNGDLYLNYASLDIFNKADGTWIYLATIAGRQGPAGPQGLAGTDGINGTDGIDGKDGVNGTDGTDGRNGSLWYNELVAPMTVDLGFDGDYYLFTNGTVFYKTGGTWAYFTSLMGPQGQTGPAGPQGETGATGATGATGLTGATGATGPQGTAGVNGLDGSDGSAGSDGSDAPWWIYIIIAAIVGGAVGSGTVIVAKRKSQKRAHALLCQLDNLLQQPPRVAVPLGLVHGWSNNRRNSLQNRSIHV